MKLSLIIVNYNTECHIHQLLGDLAQQSLSSDDWQVIVVNNAQNTKLADTIHHFYDTLPLRIVQSPHNIGFGRAMNLGASFAVGEHLLITNPDIRIDNPHFLSELYACLEKSCDYGVATCQILDDNGVDGSQFDCFEFGEKFGVQGVAWFLGAFLAIRRTVYQQIGGFNPDFFMYCEDQDLCLRIHQLGLALIKFNQLSVYHLGGASESGKTYDYFYRMYRSNFLFAHIHFSPDKFQSLLDNWYNNAQKKSQKYQRLKKLGLLLSKKHQTQYNKWQAVYAITHQIKNQGTDWLPFVIK